MISSPTYFGIVVAGQGVCGFGEVRQYGGQNQKPLAETRGGLAYYGQGHAPDSAWATSPAA